MEINDIKKELKEYFEYIKEVYLILFDKILDDETKSRIKNIDSSIIEIDESSEFKFKITDNIKIGLNIDLFVKNNKLGIEEYNDIDDIGKSKIQYYLDNKNNILKISKDNLLESLIQMFIGNNNAVTLGTTNVIASFMSKKYNLVTTNEYYKEGKVIEYLVELFGEFKFYKAVLNNKVDSLNETYTEYISQTLIEDNFKSLVSDFDKIYEAYLKNKDKVFFVDSLYYYQQLDYKDITSRLEIVIENKETSLDINIARVNSVDDCIKELDRYKFLYSNDEKVQLYYASLEIKKILSKIQELGNVDKYYKTVIEIESELKPLANKIWEYYLNFPDDYSNKDQHWFLVETLDKGYKKEEKEIIITNLITNDNIKLPSSDTRYQYGFIYRIKPEAIIYTSLDKIIFRDSCDINSNTVNVDGKCIEIDNQKYSILMTPRNLMVKTIEADAKCNRILTYTKYITKIGIFCVTNNEEDICYQKALDLASLFDLPLIPMVPNEE